MWVNIPKCYNHLKDFAVFFTTFNGKLNYLKQEYHTCIFIHNFIHYTSRAPAKKRKLLSCKAFCFFWKKVRCIFHCFPFFNIYDDDDDEEEEEEEEEKEEE